MQVEVAQSAADARRPIELPAQPTPLVGRAHTLERAKHQVLRPDVRLVTLTGPAGTGKTRLAVALAAELASEFRDGVAFVDLVPVTDPELVLVAVAWSLTVTEVGTDLAAQVRHVLAGRQFLLVLDNFELVLEAAPRIAELLAACPELTIVATSREPLRLRWECLFPVPPLGLPDLRRPPALEVLAGYPAVELFVQRAQAVQPDFALTADNARLVAEICARLDGLPLAIELAAARTTVFQPSAMLQRLQRLDLLTGGARDQPARHRTLRAAIAWSYDLLSADEQALFRRLALLVGGCTLESAEAVGGSPDGVNLAVLDGVVSLVEKNLLQQQVAPDGEPRFRMLDTIREFGLERLRAAGELAEGGRRLAMFFVELAEGAEPVLTGPEQGRWLELLEREHDNLRAALRWSLDADESEVGLRLAGALWRFWYTRGHLSEGAWWLGELLPRGASAPPAIRARALNAAGNLALARADYESARAYHGEARSLHEQVGDQRGLAHSLNNLGLVAHLQGEYADASTLLREALALRRELGDRRNIVYTLSNLGLVARNRGDHAEARALYEESLALARELGDKHGMAILLNNLGEVAHDSGDLARARAMYDESLGIRRELGDRRGVATSLLNLGKVLRDQGDHPQAAAHCRESLAQVWELGARLDLPACLEALAGVATVRGAYERAARLLGAADALRDAVGTVRPPTEQPVFTRSVSATRSALGPTGFAVAWGQGQALPLQRIVEEALAIDAELPPAPTGKAASGPVDHEVALLSQREREVAALLARGLTNRQIADQLVIGERTVDSHVGNILSKLGLTSRVQIAAWAVERRLAGTRPA